MKLKLPLLTGVACAVLALTALVGTTDTARADFNPTYEIAISESEAGATSNWTFDFGVPKGDSMFGAAVFFIPSEFIITPGDEIPIGAVVGTVNAIATLGIINGACDSSLPVDFIMLNASIDITDTVVYLDEDPEPGEDGYDPQNPGNDVPDYYEDRDDNGLQDGIEKYPDFITRTLVDEDDQPLQPIRRAAGITVVAGAEVLLQFLIFEPGTFIDEDIPSDPELGYPAVTLLQNAGDPDFDPIPGPITDFCSPLITNIVSFGISKDNTCTDSGVERPDPICSVGSAKLLQCDNTRDDDADKFINDGCPTVGDAEEAACDDNVDDDGDGAVNDGCPAVDEPEDNTPTDPDESGIVLLTNPSAGTYTFILIAAGQRDADGDGYENSLDTCAFVTNVGDPRIKGDGDLDFDGLDAACDPNDDAPSGGTNSDEDLDGFINRQDNCPLDANGENEDNQRDTDDDGIGDVCDPNPDNPDTEGELIFGRVDLDVTIGAGGPPDGDTTDDDTTGGADDDDDGGSAILFIIIGIIAAVVVLGGGAFFLSRRSGSGGA